MPRVWKIVSADVAVGGDREGRVSSRSPFLHQASFLFLGLLLLVTSYNAKEASSAEQFIPMELSQRELGVYQKLEEVSQRRKESNQVPRPVVVITDVGKDYDDLAALVVLSVFHHLGFIELRAVVANLIPAEKRAHLAKAALESLGLGDVPVAFGTRGSPDDHEVLDYEFKGAEFSTGASVELENGKALLTRVYQTAKEKDEKLYLLCLSSLQDIFEFASANTDLVVKYTAEVHMQSGVSENEHNLKPDGNAANNRFNLDAAVEWYLFIQRHAIRSHIYTKNAAFITSLDSGVFKELAATGHPIGAYLRRVQVEQDVAFYKRACESDPGKRFAPSMDQTWFLDHKTNWHLRPHPSEGDTLPIGEEVIPYLTKIVLYDVLAALGVAGDDVVDVLKNDIKVESEELGESGSGKTMHYSVTNKSVTSEDADRISLEVASLLKGALSGRSKSVDSQ
ncbi:hypothetical protein M758_3G248400 [Ceratodon purpureus]|nr:hypothetical protein M758_3G248100 [Ceratodon purpureus]KAG0624446.1 hypothetical protein M758_3G248400 [Ceratodon purpureus]